jgi:hypothetical protein
MVKNKFKQKNIKKKKKKKKIKNFFEAPKKCPNFGGI